jgi:uncharacterized membrane protein
MDWLLCYAPLRLALSRGDVMAFCSVCGTRVDQAAFCSKCGTRQTTAAAPPPATRAGSTGGISENVAAALSYALGWFTGIVFLLLDKRPYVKFHAAQSIVVFGGLHIVRMVVGTIGGIGWLSGGTHFIGPGFFMFHIISLLSFVLWILLMVKAYQGERFKIPIASDLAESLAGK